MSAPIQDRVLGEPPAVGPGGIRPAVILLALPVRDVGRIACGAVKLIRKGEAPLGARDRTSGEQERGRDNEETEFYTMRNTDDVKYSRWRAVFPVKNRETTDESGRQDKPQMKKINTDEENKKNQNYRREKANPTTDKDDCTERRKKDKPQIKKITINKPPIRTSKTMGQENVKRKQPDKN